MARELTPSELNELLGAYALDAVDGDEREQIEQWLDRTPAARAELAELRDTAALLAQGAEAPPEVWSRIEDALTVPPPPLVLPNRRRFAIRITAGLAAASAAAAAITAVVLTDEMSQQEERLESLAQSVHTDGTRRAAMAALADPEARTLRLTAADGASATVVLMPDGSGYLMSAHLPRLSEGRTYQLWAMTGDPDHPSMVSAGVLGRDVELAAFHVSPRAHGFAITAEEAPGSSEPHGPHTLEGSYT